jgi:hypothetical protein
LDLLSHELRQQLRLAEASHGPALRQQQHGGSSSSSQHRASAESDVVGFSSLYSWGNGANFTLGTGEQQHGFGRGPVQGVCAAGNEGVGTVDMHEGYRQQWVQLFGQQYVHVCIDVGSLSAFKAVFSMSVHLVTGTY